jgi:hypothetical protein
MLMCGVSRVWLLLTNQWGILSISDFGPPILCLANDEVDQGWQPYVRIRNFFEYDWKLTSFEFPSCMTLI